MARYRETKSRNSVTKDYGGRVQVRTTIPPNTCHPGENVEFHSKATPPVVWKCAKCGNTILIEKIVNHALISDRGEP